MHPAGRYFLPIVASAGELETEIVELRHIDRVEGVGKISGNLDQIVVHAVALGESVELVKVGGLLLRRAVVSVPAACQRQGLAKTGAPRRPRPRAMHRAALMLASQPQPSGKKGGNNRDWMPRLCRYCGSLAIASLVAKVSPGGKRHVHTETHVQNGRRLWRLPPSPR
jgi:hypothetical protein